MATQSDDHPIDALEDAAPIPSILKENSDKAFFIRFTLVLIVLSGLTGGFMLAAQLAGETRIEPRFQYELVDDRTRPIGNVATTAEAAAALSGAEESAEEPILISGEQAVQEYCSVCHADGLLGAPRNGDTAEWKRRELEAGGADSLLASAIRGKGQMPPRGGVPLSDESLQEAIALLQK